MIAFGLGAYVALFAFGVWLLCKHAPVVDDPPRFSPSVVPVDDFLTDDELLTEVLAVEVDAFIAECLGETA